MGVQIGGLVGLLGGMICGLAGWYFGRRSAKKERGLDEVHDFIWQKARSYSWYVTLVILYVLFFLYVFGVAISVPVALGILMFVHLFSWAIIGVILSSNLYDEEKGQKHLNTFVISFIIVFIVSVTVIIAVGKLI